MSKSVETNNDKAVYIIGAILLFVLIIAILIIVRCWSLVSQLPG